MIRVLLCPLYSKSRETSFLSSFAFLGFWAFVSALSAIIHTYVRKYKIGWGVSTKNTHLRNKQFFVKINDVVLINIPGLNDLSFSQGWETLTSAVVKQISNQCSGVVFLLWGSYAQKKGDIVDKKKHHLLKSVHPSPLSAHRGFLGCQHFSLCNEILENQGKSPIDWKRLDDDID